MKASRIYCCLKHLLSGLLLLPGLLMAASCTNSEDQSVESDARFLHSASKELTVGGYEAAYDLQLESFAGVEYTITILQEEPAWCWTSRQNQATEKQGVMTLSQRVEKLYVAANGSSQPRVATIRVAFDGGPTVELILTQGSYDHPAVYDKPWPELPAYKADDNCLTVTHYAEIRSGEEVRNYTLCFDTSLGYSIWCAYPLHRCYMQGGYHRTNDWQYDPKIPIEYQADLTLGSYRGYGWVRGHQVMSNHRYTAYSDELNAQTFYSTNIMPQDYDFNSGLWNEVEIACTQQSCADTLYCVTGAWGNQEYTTDKAGRRVAVPAYCFKAMLRTRNGRTGKRIAEITDPSELKAIAYWAPNSEEGNEGRPSDYTMPVAELESLIGICLFPMLDESVAEAVKQQNRPDEWGIR